MKRSITNYFSCRWSLKAVARSEGRSITRVVRKGISEVVTFKIRPESYEFVMQITRRKSRFLNPI